MRAQEIFKFSSRLVAFSSVYFKRIDAAFHSRWEHDPGHDRPAAVASPERENQENSSRRGNDPFI